MALALKYQNINGAMNRKYIKLMSVKGLTLETRATQAAELTEEQQHSNPFQGVTTPASSIQVTESPPPQLHQTHESPVTPAQMLSAAKEALPPCIP